MNSKFVLLALININNYSFFCSVTQLWNNLPLEAINCTNLTFFKQLICDPLLGRHGSVSLCRVERENKMAATYNVLAFKR